tara:strand:- start:2196 stop:3719 length:1524 start_codon:yes stop_codon:yes gene_type:complete
MSLLNRFPPERKADINRKSLFRKLKVVESKAGDINLNNAFNNKILTRCGYQLSDFKDSGNFKLSSITSVDQIPLKTETTGIFTIRQTEHQSKDTSANLFVIKNSEQSSLVINNGSFPRESGKSASIITTTEMALDFTTLTDVSNSKLIDVYTKDSQFGSHLGEFTTYTALRDISNGAVCMTELSNNTVYAVMTDPSRNSLSGNAVKYLLGVALDDASATKPVRILSNGYCTIRGDFLKQVPEDPNGVVQGQVSLDKETTGLTYLTDVSGIIFTDSGGTLQNYSDNQSYQVTFDAGFDKTIDLSINELFTEHGYSSLYDRLGFQVSDDGTEWENADISGLIQTRETELLPPWPPGGNGTAKNGSVSVGDINTGWIFPERHEFDEPNSLFVTRRDNSGNPDGDYGAAYMSQIKAEDFGDKMKRYIRFYFRSDRSGDFVGWNILVKSSVGAPAFDNSVVANAILYLSQSGVGKATAFTGSGIRLGYSVIDSSSNETGEDFTYARIQDTNN